MENYSINFNNKSCILPAYNIEVVKKLEEIDARAVQSSYSVRLEIWYNFLVELLGEEQVKNLLGGNFEEVDANDIHTLYVNVVDKYNEPQTKRTIKSNSDAVKDNLKAIQSDKLIELVNALSAVETLK